VCTRARTHTYEPFHAFLRHAGKFTPAKRREGETRETESPITFSISGRAELSSCLSSGALALVLIINAFGSWRSFPQRSAPFLPSHCRLICYSLARLTFVCGPRAFAPTACYTSRLRRNTHVRRVASRRPPVDQIASFRHARAIKTNNRLFALMRLHVRPE